MDELKELLKTSVVRVTFTKADGSKRVMDCTTNPSLIPLKTSPAKALAYETALLVKLKRPYTPSPNVIVAYDTEINEWRSFRKDSVIGYEMLLGNADA